MKAVSRSRTFWPDQDGFFGTFKALWMVFPEERWRLIPLGLICGLLTPLVILVNYFPRAAPTWLPGKSRNSPQSHLD